MSAAKGGPPTLLGVTAIKPVERKGMEAIRYFIHNPDTGEFFTRTPKSWALILIFYLIYYTCLAAFWYGLLMAVFSTMPTSEPKFTLDESLIGDIPALGMRPVQTDKRIDSSMVMLNKYAKDERPSRDFETESNIDWAKRLQKFLKLYANTTGTKECGTGDSPNKDESCRFDINVLGACKDYPYGYQIEGSETQVQPCVMFKPNRLYNWEPQEYDTTELPEDMPDHVADLVKRDPKKLYVDCQGENPYDREGLGGKMTYFPADQGIDFKYFPYIHVDGNYHNPVVAVKFGADVELGRLFHIECKLWGKGIAHNRKDRIGLFHMELIIQ